jgi:hypothetical protein
LEHFLAAFVFNVDVDVRRFIAGGGDEALKEQIDACGIDAGDAQAIADSAVGGRSAALAENSARAREANQIIDGEEIGFDAKLGDELEFVLDKLADFVGDGGGRTPTPALPLSTRGGGKGLSTRGVGRGPCTW